MKLHHYILTLAYNGVNYHGSQVENELPDDETIEEVLFKALHNAGFAENPPKGFQRTSRTDTGVSAIAAAFSCWIKAEPEEILTIKLPRDIKILAVERAYPTFNLLKFCTSRVYLYYVPLAAIRLSDSVHSVDEQLPEGEKYYSFIKCYYAEGEVLQRINLLCRLFIGIHDFASFTQPSTEYTKREIFDFACLLNDGFYRFQISGSSFLKHMIRRIVFCVISCVNGQMPVLEVVRLLCGAQQRVLEKVPGKFLVLYRQEFRSFEGHRLYFQLDCTKTDVIRRGEAFLGDFWRALRFEMPSNCPDARPQSGGDGGRGGGGEASETSD